ncbi:MAG: hypothetical protein WDN01_07530 [Rhizomicrobium sp.]
MTIKSAKPESNVPVEDDEDFLRPPTEQETAELDAWIERNKDALNASIRRAREDFARGESYTLEDVMAEIRERRRLRTCQDE